MKYEIQNFGSFFIVIKKTELAHSRFFTNASCYLIKYDSFRIDLELTNVEKPRRRRNFQGRMEQHFPESPRIQINENFPSLIDFL